jgi:hypothetical protein
MPDMQAEFVVQVTVSIGPLSPPLEVPELLLLTPPLELPLEPEPLELPLPLLFELLHPKRATAATDTTTPTARTIFIVIFLANPEVWSLSTALTRKQVPTRGRIRLEIANPHTRAAR